MNSLDIQAGSISAQSDISNSKDFNDAQVQVRFLTRQNEYTIPSTPIFVPVRLGGNEISEIISHILNLDRPITFEFIINNQHLKDTLGSHISANKLSTESVLEIEYFLASPKPSGVTVCDYKDWISSISSGNFRGEQLVLCGSFGGEAFICDLSGSIVTRIASEAQVNTVGWIDPVGLNGNEYFVYGGDDRHVTLAQYLGNSGTKSVYTGILNSPVMTLKSLKGRNLFLSGCWDGSIHLWKIPSERNLNNSLSSQFEGIFDGEDDDLNSRPSRRRRITVEDNSKTEIPPESTLKGSHSSAVTCISYGSSNSVTPNVFYSGSHDQKLLQWDLQTGRWIHSMHATSAILCMDFSESLNAIITGHTDNSIRIWDARSSSESSGVSSVTRFSGKNAHRSWVSSIKCAPEGYHTSYPYVFATCSYDSFLKVWDIRSTIPLYSINTSSQEYKLLAVDWARNNVLVCGGQECKLKFFY